MHHRLARRRDRARAGAAVPIWATGDDPAVLEAAGRKADGWVAFFDPGRAECVRIGNKVVDEAALAAGRDPREIRRILVVTGEVPVSVLDDGVSTIILRADDEEIWRRFARETVPALRAAAPAGLLRPADPARFGAGPATGGRRLRRRARVAGRHRRRTGRPDLLARVQSNYLRGGAPGLLLSPRDTAQVVDALAFARRHPGLPLGVRSGGHGVSGRSTNDGGIVIDLRHLNTIEVLDETTRRVRIGPGARWKEVAAALRPHGWAISSGDYGGVGVGGRYRRGHRLPVPQTRTHHRQAARGADRRWPTARWSGPTTTRTPTSSGRYAAPEPTSGS